MNGLFLKMRSWSLLFSHSRKYKSIAKIYQKLLSFMSMKKCAVTSLLHVVVEENKIKL